MSIVSGRMTVDNSEDLVVFLIGGRVNRWWYLPIVLPILTTMIRMLRELKKDPALGLLGVQSLGYGGMVQYWKSIEHLQRYANDRQRAHKPAWIRFMQRIFRNHAAGIWHETYVVRGGNYESIYGNMPRFGLGTFKPLIPATGAISTAAKRLGRTGEEG
jgi:hypothetical protein